MKTNEDEEISQTVNFNIDWNRWISCADDFAF